MRFCAGPPRKSNKMGTKWSDGERSISEPRDPTHPEEVDAELKLGLIDDIKLIKALVPA